MKIINLFGTERKFEIIFELLAAILLGAGRAIGETMAVLMATGHAGRENH